MDFRKLLNELEVLDRPPATVPKEIELNKPGGFNVVVLNDNITPFEVVVEAMRAVLGISEDAAYRRMMRAHRGGWAVVATYASADIADTIATRLTEHCRSNTNYDHYRNNPMFPAPPNGPRGYRGPWPTTFEVMEAG